MAEKDKITSMFYFTDIMKDENGLNRYETYSKHKFDYDIMDISYEIPTGQEGRPDLIAVSLYNNWELWWFICLYNSIKDPMFDLQAGMLLKAPTEQRLWEILLNANSI